MSDAAAGLGRVRRASYHAELAVHSPQTDTAVGQVGSRGDAGGHVDSTVAAERVLRVIPAKAFRAGPSKGVPSADSADERGTSRSHGGKGVDR